MKLLIITQKVNKNDQLLGFFIRWLELFSSKFEKINVLCLERGEFKLPQNVEVFSLGKDAGYSKIRQLSTFYLLLSTLKYDAVLVHMNPIWVVLGGPMWKMLNKKIFFWYTSGGVTGKLKIAEKLADIIFTASKESFRLPSKKVIVTGHGIDTAVFAPANHKSQITNHKLKLLSVGRISPVKNYETLINASKILRDGGIDFSATMAGEAPLIADKNYELKIKNKVKELGLENNFNFVGKIDHDKLPELYQSHNIFIHLSKTGSLDKAILEAMACGMNVLSSSDSAKVFLSGNLIFKADDSADLAGKIITIRDSSPDTTLREYVVKNHNLENLINKLSELIQK